VILADTPDLSFDTGSLRSYTEEEISITSLLLRITEHPASHTEKPLMAIYNGTSVRNVWSGTSSAHTAYSDSGDDSSNGL
jgi:hypothetical protein